MTHPTFDNLPSRPRFHVESEDPYLRETLSQYAYCEIYPEFKAEMTALNAELSTPDMITRLYRALSAEEEQLRVKSAKRLVSRRAPDSESILMRFLNSDRIYDRLSLAPLGTLFDSEQVLTKLIELVKDDPSSNVRAQACYGLRDKDLQTVIPVLLNVMHEDGSDHLDETIPPSVAAELVLDEILGTSFMAIRVGRGIFTSPPGGADPEALEAKAKQVLKELQDQSSETRPAANSHRTGRNP